MITGNVQDIGFRAIIEDIARHFDLQGFAFNDVDGSVKMVCCCENGILNEFLNEIRIKGIQKGAKIYEILKEEIPFQIYLPQKFVRLYTDKLEDIGRKLDIGNDVLVNIDSKLLSADDKLFNMDDKLFSINEGVGNLNTSISSFVIEQREHNKRMDEHNYRLEKILEKLTDN